tara:strand:+ start:732 stop:860 length:129 start_codon:yes stop_codon:yes gene_type:complete
MADASLSKIIGFLVDASSARPEKLISINALGPISIEIMTHDF